MQRLCEEIGPSIEWNPTQMTAFPEKCNWCAAAAVLFSSPLLSSSLLFKARTNSNLSKSAGSFGSAVDRSTANPRRFEVFFESSSSSYSSSAAQKGAIGFGKHRMIIHRFSSTTTTIGRSKKKQKKKKSNVKKGFD